ncbi:hypothetical protein CUMW_211630 [Citrus unshiu]|nr:hypothetical protein CUMW_211630 [Citrus unshiu]
MGSKTAVLFLVALLFVSVVSSGTLIDDDDQLIRQVTDDGDEILSHHESSNNDLLGAEHHFSLFTKKFNKAYASQEEHDRRFNIFKANLRRAASHQKLDPSATHGVTQFSDLTPAEFRRTYLGLMRKLRLPKDANQAPILPTNDLPADFDYKSLVSC